MVSWQVKWHPFSTDRRWHKDDSSEIDFIEPVETPRAYADRIGRDCIWCGGNACRALNRARGNWHVRKDPVDRQPIPCLRKERFRPVLQ